MQLLQWQRLQPLLFWSGVLFAPTNPSHQQINALIINTTETIRQRFFLERFLSLDKQLLFVGPTGTGKSAITNNYLLDLPRDKYIISNINFSAQTSANQTQDIIFSKLDRFDLRNEESVFHSWNLTSTPLPPPPSLKHMHVQTHACMHIHTHKHTNNTQQQYNNKKTNTHKVSI